MKYSTVNGERSEANPSLSGHCPSCGSTTISKCGKVKIWHWAHKGKLMCDPWWENETEWHRIWKGQFPKECQEIVQYAKSGEKHIADVKTSQGWVIEFQNSYIKPEERTARNAFYVKLVWVVNGMRRIRDKQQFLEILNEPNIVTMNGKPINPHTRKVYLDDCALLREWSGIHAPVFFDFGETVLWCLLPAGQKSYGYIVPFPRNEFIELHNRQADHKNSFEECLNNLNTMVDLVSKHFNSDISITTRRSKKLEILEAIDARNIGVRATQRR